MASRHTSPERASRNLSPTFRKAVREEKGCICANCGSAERIEYHHIVPIILGGADGPGNMVALCHACHQAAHTGRHMSTIKRGLHIGGRPAKCSDEDAFRALDMLTEGLIGIRRCKQLMRLSGRTEPRTTAQYKRWCADRGIADVRNFLDASIVNGAVADGDVIGAVTYADGANRDIVFQDTGENDGIEYVLRGRKNEGARTFAEIKAEGRGRVLEYRGA